MPDNLSDVTVQRIVVRNGLSHDLADELLDDIREQVAFLDDLDGPMPREDVQPAFHH
jgi:glutamate decarboxylase